MAAEKPQQGHLRPFPAPLQAANRLLCELEPFRNPHPLNPKHLSFRRGSDYKLPPPTPRNPLIAKEILQFDRERHADGLKTVARPPVPQAYRGTNLVGIETLAPHPGFGLLNGAMRTDSPPDSCPAELDLPSPALQFYRCASCLERLRFGGAQMHQP
jgi:hypothetical protein